MILDAIFSGDFSIENFSRPTDPEYQKLCEEISNLMDSLEQQDSQQAAAIKELLSKVYDAHYLETARIFKLGFAAGLTLQQEAGDLLKDISVDN